MRIIRPVDGYDDRRFTEDVLQLSQAYPFLRIGTIGHSVMGKPLRVLRIGNGPAKVHMNAAFHANEWLTSLLLMSFAEEAAEHYRQHGGQHSLWAGVQLDVVPMVNPDGVDLAVHGIASGHPHQAQLLAYNEGSSDFTGWKANIRGVDLNDQFPAHWEEERRRRGPKRPAPRDFVGDSPLTEPEARAIAELVLERDYHAVVALHTQGEEIYWNYRGYEPPHAKAWADALGTASGYAPVELTGSDAGFKDWFIERFGRPGFTVEAGYGVNPLPISDFETIRPKTSALLWELLRLASEG